MEKSKYANNLVLKGGLFIYSITNFDSRVTVDVDFLLRKISNIPEQMKLVLEEIISCDTGNNFITFEVKSVAPIAIAKKYAGIGASIVARIKNTRTPLSIDFGVGDVIVPKQEKRKIPTQLELKKTFANRNHTFTVEQFEQIMTYDADDGMQKKWKTFIKKVHTKTDDFKIVLETIRNFLKEPFMATFDGAEFVKQWVAHTGEWR